MNQPKRLRSISELACHGIVPGPAVGNQLPHEGRRRPALVTAYDGTLRRVPVLSLLDRALSAYLNTGSSEFQNFFGHPYPLARKF